MSMTWKAPSRGHGSGLIGKLAQANIDEVAPVDDEVIVVRDDDPASAPVRQRLTAGTLLRVREVTGAEELAELTAGGRTRAVVLCRGGLSLVTLHEAVAVVRRACPDTALIVLDDQAENPATRWPAHAGADGLINLAQDWRVVGEAVLAAAERRARARAVGDAIGASSDADLLAALEGQWPLALLVVAVNNLEALAGRYAHGDTDALLLSLAIRLRPLLRPSDTMARTADRSLVIARNDGDELAIAALADRLLRACREPLLVTEESVPVTIAVGIAIGIRPTVAERTLRGRCAGAGARSPGPAPQPGSRRLRAGRHRAAGARHRPAPDRDRAPPRHRRARVPGLLPAGRGRCRPAVSPPSRP